MDRVILKHVEKGSGIIRNLREISLASEAFLSTVLLSDQKRSATKNKADIHQDLEVPWRTKLYSTFPQSEEQSTTHREDSDNRSVSSEESENVTKPTI